MSKTTYMIMAALMYLLPFVAGWAVYAALHLSVAGAAIVTAIGLARTVQLRRRSRA